MNRQSAGSGLVVGLAAAFLFGACGPGGSPAVTVSPTLSTPAASSSPTSSATSAPAPTATPSVTRAAAIPYESTNPLLLPGDLDVFAPARAGHWPVVVMFHGSPPSNTKDSLRAQASAVANLGYVVFDANWGHAAEGSSPASYYAGVQAGIREAACAVAFAQSHAAEYGGDPATLIVYGHSAGANVGTMVAFARPEPTAGCLGGATLGAITGLVTYEGDWMAIDPTWDSVLAADPRFRDLYTPWTYLAQHADLPVAMLVSESPGPYWRDVADPAVANTFFAPRDPSGSLRAKLEQMGALADGRYDLTELQQLLYSVLKAQGNPVSLDVLPESSHDVLRGKGWDVLLAAFGKVVGSS